MPFWPKAGEEKRLWLEASKEKVANHMKMEKQMLGKLFGRPSLTMGHRKD